MALGFFKKPRISAKNTSKQMPPVQPVDHDPPEWARIYMEAIAAKATRSVADKVTVTLYNRNLSINPPSLIMASDSAPATALGDGVGGPV
ncbi:uncharacterized protein LAESUDRAFT_728224 [Laetiporus sulphureus 93-53]|uniref:Uncharacterized protein n=1 Tax=Laetiporus sulphureus 93-53 TaxID=1314785 RepID=A0A165D9E8_9APHY|nr:uncharacterized protein LAESUDRAFT_728224 [Laetiporus sulphureus 93-53]KZT04377.1 hypothetical protein LAESUDRAFT_728224 [Laetiporus sulphureus 93-53]